MSHKANIVMMSTRPDLFKIGFSCSMSAEDKDTGEIKLYGQIISNMPDTWKYDDQDKSAEDFDKAVKKLKEDGAKKLLLRINSPGGIVNEAVAMRSILANAGFESINIRIEGWCASAATIIATLPGCHVAITEGSEFMIHNPSTVAWGNADDIEKTVVHLRNIESNIRTMYTKRTGKPDEEIKKMMDAETWLSAENAVKEGFADEVIDESKEEPAAASVSSQFMTAMKGMYHAIPEGIRISDEAVPEDGKNENSVNDDASNGTSKGGCLTRIDNSKKEENNMELKDITMEQLASERPDLLDSVRQEAVKAERTRLEDIDALTIPGYEDMAEKAKADGTSAVDFQKQVVSAMKQKGKNFLDQRTEETKPAQDVRGGEPASNAASENEEINEYAGSMAEYAKEYAGSTDGAMF